MSEGSNTRPGNLLCARGKKDMSAWMKQFTRMIDDYLSQNERL
jgi:hypothetical protein